MKKASCCLIWATIIGVILLIAGIVVIPVAKNLIHNKITEQITLKSNATYQNWVKNPTPIFFQLWVWDLQNPDEVKNGGKPSLVQRGPYSYRENRHKINVSFHDENDTVTYKEDKYYVFDRAMSNGTEDDKFTTVNIPLMKIADALIEWGEKDVFMTLSVKDLVWGYDEPLINKTVTLLQELGLPIHIDDHFGLFVGQGIDLYRFSTPPDVFMSHIDNPANQGYCTPSDNCLPSGLLNMENCHDGAPLVFSQPHFLNADKAVINGVYGMHPNIEEHGTFIDIEPNTGAAFYAAKKLQANIALERVPNIKSTLKLPTVVLPVVWLNESSKITKSLADEFKSELQTPLLVIHVGTYLAIGLGAFLVLMSLTVAIFRKLREKQKNV
ncbi:SCRB2-like protein [Mya arenaria]|uniref:SCRB2-like protein n=1 Tax=Mya arenaria TaxID=6604 RepID=A0ABY7E0X2_MYAAR|nr:SCRB2-like protein [Mya arenaria]